MQTLRYFLLLLFCSISLYVYPQGAKTLAPASRPEDVGLSSARLTRMDAVLNEYVTQHAIPGAVVLLVRKGRIVYHKAYGYSDTEKNTVMKRDAIFRIASQTKAITSLAAMMLWEEGKFLLDDPISKYIPEFKDPKILKSFNAADSSYTTEPAKGEITVRHLFTHSSGVDYAGIGSREFKAIYAKADIRCGIGTSTGVLADKMRKLGTLPLKHEPGERWTYGLNTDILGYLVEVWSGMSLNDFYTKRIFTPLGMKDTHFYQPAENYNRLVSLHRENEGRVVPIHERIYDGTDPDYPNLKGTYYSGGAGLSSTVEDYAKFLQLFLNQGEFNGVRLLSRKTIELMLTNQMPVGASPFGLGFSLETPVNDATSPLSLGSFSWGGIFNTQYWVDPKEQLVALIYTNLYNTKAARSLGDKFKALTYQAIND